jgi:hypothetical protein
MLKLDKCNFQILKDFNDKGEEELALEETMQKKTAAARRKAATRTQRSEYTLISQIGSGGSYHEPQSPELVAGRRLMKVQQHRIQNEDAPCLITRLIPPL